MLARLRDTEIYFDVVGAGLVADGERMRERPVAFIIHGGPGSDHSDLKAALSPLSETMQLVFFDHRGQGRSARGDAARYVLDENVEDMEALRRHLGLGPIVSIGTSYDVMGPLYSLRHNAEVAQRSRGRAIYSPEAITRAFAPGGFLRSFDLRPELAAITAPTLILAGRHDWICPPEFSEEIQRLIPGSDLRI